MDSKISQTPSNSTSSKEINCSQLIESMSGYFLLINPDLTLKAASQAYLQTTLQKKKEIIGENFLKLFHTNNPEIHSPFISELYNSIQQVLVNKKTHSTEILKIIIADPHQPGYFIEKYWSSTNTPILDNEGEVSFIIHQGTDETERFLIEEKLKESKAREKSALAETEHRRKRMEDFLTQVPAGICIFSGPDFIYEFVNPTYQKQLFPGREILGKPLFEAVPEVKNQPIEHVLKKVYETGKTIEGKEMHIPLAHYDDGPLVDHYFNFIQQARYNEKGEINGIMTFAYDITELVVARNKMEENAAALKILNQELEERVKTRTKELQFAQQDAERQKERLHSLFMEAPAAICILEGPDLVFEFINPPYQNLFAGRELYKKPVLKDYQKFPDKKFMKYY